MQKQILDYHSGRGIAMSRLMLAIIFIVVLSADPDQPVRNTSFAFVVLGSYAALSVLGLVMIWNDWWLDFKLRLPAIIGDGTIYLVAMYFTGGASNDFTSPFLSSFIFIILSATVRWQWKGMVSSALVLSFLYLLASAWFEIAVPDHDIYRFARRGMYMILLSLILVWFGLQRGVRAVGRLDFASEEEEEEEVPIAEIARYAMQATGSPTAVVGWWSNEEPHVLACVTTPGDAVVRYLSPNMLALPDEQAPSLFDRKRSRRLTVAGNGTIMPSQEHFAAPLAEYFGIDNGLAVPIASSSGRGLLIVTGNPALSIDQLGMASGLAQEIAAALDRQSLSRISREAAVSQLRTALARDLHDSVAQTLAGVRFRLEAIRAQIRAGADPDADFDELKASLTGEQRHLRLIIERLRRTELEPRRVALAPQMMNVAAELERNWRAKLNLSITPDNLTVSIGTAFEIMQIAREAVANGARHGQAKTFDLAVVRTDSGIDLDIRDDGTGFTGDPPPHPRTLAERARANGGQLTIFNNRPGAHLLITLPDRIQ